MMEERMKERKEIFATPAVGAIVEKEVDGVPHILLQTRRKKNDLGRNGKLELPAGRIRQYENIFQALRREVWEETGLTVTHIQGMDAALLSAVDGMETLCMEPFCVNQNLNGVYSIILSVFLCRAEGEPAAESDESCDIHWEKAETVKKLLQTQPERFFLMSVNPLKKYFGLR